MLNVDLGLLRLLQLRSCKHQAHNRQLTRPPNRPFARERRRKTLAPD